MPWIEFVTLAALLEYFVFSILVGRARARYGVQAPAITGHAGFERAYRVQMNTLELLVMFLPVLWLASRYWPTVWTAAIGAVYLVGRLIYARAYVRDPAGRGLGFAMSMLPILALLGLAAAGALGWH
jgi:glutathione S-transferase